MYLLWYDLYFSSFTYHIWQIHSFSHFGFIKGVRVTFDRVCSVCSILRLMQSIPVDNVKVFPPSTTPQIELKQSWLTHPQGWHTIQAEEKDELLGTEILILKKSSYTYFCWANKKSFFLVVGPLRGGGGGKPPEPLRKKNHFFLIVTKNDSNLKTTKLQVGEGGEEVYPDLSVRPKKTFYFFYGRLPQCRQCFLAILGGFLN